MRTVIVLIQELLNQLGQFLVVLSGFVFQPLLERADKALGDAVGLGPLAGNQDVDKLFREHEHLEGLGCEMGGPRHCRV